jgi:hypothetical protein
VRISARGRLREPHLTDDQEDKEDDKAAQNDSFHSDQV